MNKAVPFLNTARDIITISTQLPTLKLLLGMGIPPSHAEQAVPEAFAQNSGDNTASALSM